MGMMRKRRNRPVRLPRSRGTQRFTETKTLAPATPPQENAEADEPPTVATAVRGKRVAVYAYIEDEFGRVLLTRSGPDYPWSLPCGLVGDRESLPDATRRIVEDEVGLRVRAAEPIFVCDRATDGLLSAVFRVYLSSGNRGLPCCEIEMWDFDSGLPEAVVAPDTIAFCDRMRRRLDLPPIVAHHPDQN